MCQLLYGRVQGAHRQGCVLVKQRSNVVMVNGHPELQTSCKYMILKTLTTIASDSTRLYVPLYSNISTAPPILINGGRIVLPLSLLV